jgi:phytoene dehydrogenase-like protein
VSERWDAVVVGSGPNGLAAAVKLAEAGLSVLVLEGAETLGGGCRTAELTLPGFRHDLCSAVHPLAAASPYLSTLPLEKFGLEWIYPPAAAAHPLGDGCVLLGPSLEATARNLGADGARYEKLMRPLVSHWEAVFREVLRPALHLPRHPLLLGRFGALSLFSASDYARLLFRGDRARALFGGIAAHSNAPLARPGTAAVGLLLNLAAHGKGWPFPKGGAQELVRALAGYFRSLGGELRCGQGIRNLRELPPSRLVLLDMGPPQAAALLAEKLSPRSRSKLERFRYGPGVFKLDWALERPIPWRAPEAGQAATVHLGGTLEELAASERAVAEGRHPERPYVLLSQPTLFDGSRAPAGKHVAWAYCHVPHGSLVDVTKQIEAQVERFAPGFQRTILARSKRNTAQLEAYNPNLVGGDIGGGDLSLASLLFRPAFRRDPYALPAPGFYLCSASTPPGPGVHGMCGYWAAVSALRWLKR